VGRVLVTGGSGFVGLPTLRALAGREDEVYALTTRADPLDVPGVRWRRVDLAGGEQLEELLEELRPERLVHLAWYVEHGRFWDAVENVAWVECSLRLLRAFIDAGGRRAVMLGTCAEYDWGSADEPLRETDARIAPATLYGTAKDALRRLADALAARQEVELAWGRLFFLYGPREPPGRLVPSVIRSLLDGAVAKTTRGVQRRDFLHVDDVAGAIAALLDSSVTGPVNIASGQAVAVSELVDLIAQAVGRPELVQAGALPDRASEPPLLVADAGRLTQEVGYSPRWTLEDGIADTVAWWREQRRGAKPRS
jgi:nucleoside-diphosphate-sugar epimerase